MLQVLFKGPELQDITTGPNLIVLSATKTYQALLILKMLYIWLYIKHISIKLETDTKC